MPAPNDKMFGKHGGFPGKGNAYGRPEFVDDLIPFDRDPTPEPCVELSLDVGEPLNPSARVIDASVSAFCFYDIVEAPTGVTLTGFSDDDVIRVIGADRDDYNFSTGGGGAGDADDLRITYNDGTRITQIVIEDVLTSGGLVFDYESAVAAVGHEFMTFEDSVEESIDVGFPSFDDPVLVELDAGGGAYLFTDTYLDRTLVDIANFGIDDVIVVSNASEGDYQFSAVIGREEDLAITTLIGAELYRVVLNDVLPAGAVVTDYASAAAAIGREFMVFDGLPNLPAGACWAGSIDYGTLGEAPVVATAGNLVYCFQDDESAETNVAIYAFGPDDVIDIGIVADPDSEYLFSAIDFDGAAADDLLMQSYVLDAAGNQVITGEIIIVDLLADGASVNDYATAYAEAGFYFLAFSPPPGESIVQSIDVGNSGGTPVTFVAAGNPHIFTDTLAVQTNVIISGFGADDVIEVTGIASLDDYSFGTAGADPSDLVISYYDGANYTRIVLDNVLTGSGFVFDYDTAMAAVGHDFMTLG